MDIVVDALMPTSDLGYPLVVEVWHSVRGWSQRPRTQGENTLAVSRAGLSSVRLLFSAGL